MTLHTAPNIPLVQTDYGKVQQILYNLVSNAIKFTPNRRPGGVRVYMPDDVTVRISVTDTGQALHRRIARRFSRSSGRSTGR